MLPDSSLIMCGFSYNGLDDDFLLTKALVDYTSNVYTGQRDIQIDVFPNPASDYVNVALPEMIQGRAVVNIYSLDGQSKRYTSINDLENTFTISLEEMNSGVYYIQIVSENFTITRPVVVRK